MTTGPYREHEAPKPIKEPWWLGPKRAARAAFSWLGKKLRPFIIAVAAAATPAVIAHMLGMWSWHWAAVFSLISVATWAGVSAAGADHPAPWLIGGMAYFGALVVMTMAPPSGSSVCKDEVERVAPSYQCDHGDHDQVAFEFDGDLYAVCKCKR